MFICPAEGEQAEHEVVITRRTGVRIRPGQRLVQGEFHAASLLIGQPGLPLGLKVGNQCGPESERALTLNTAVENLDCFRGEPVATVLRAIPSSRLSRGAASGSVA